MRVYSILLFFGLCLALGACNNENVNERPQQKYDIPAIDQLSQLIAKSPQDASLYADRSRAFWEAELYKEAELDAEKALALDSTKVEYYAVLADAYFDNQHSLSAIKVLEKAIDRFPQAVPLYLKLAEMQNIVKQYQEGMLILDKLEKIQPSQPDALYLRGNMLRDMGDTAQAMESFQATVEQDADYLDAYMQLAILGDKINAPYTVSYIDNALRIDSTYEDALLLKAQYYHFRSQFEEAEATYKQGILRQPMSPNLNYNLALMYLELGDSAAKQTEKAQDFFTKALRHFDNATKFDPQFADAYYYKAIAAERLGKKEIALKEYENALNMEVLLKTVDPATVEAAMARLRS
ncbi:tetratricopeptide repeat protein [Saprospira sp. CCB-QB6]|uniref:tetratricopeptide repeat protein n=1 Tax=Saprospira sp. CCB-QB6 TaxID=3023936 RepID=UPI002349B215|nr:tetratricopeptide repeat protein [Saprospira sp. CCB-QB6]WCL81518.1 tetratricopeptide repeat protein [Saprospira sp. CCB-QB6]